MNQPSQSRVVVVGAGIAGLAAAYRLASAGVDVVVLEREARIGGKILTRHVDGSVVEGGPETFLAAKPQAVALCDELGVPLVEDTPAGDRAMVMRHGRLYPIPDGMSGLALRRVGPLIRTPLLGLTGGLRAAAERWVPQQMDSDDESLASFVRRRLGRRAWERLLEPLTTGVFACDGERLSVRAAFPTLVAAERAGGLIRSANRGAASPLRHGFVSPEGGMDQMVRRLRDRMPGVEIATEEGAETIRAARGCYGVVTTRGRTLHAAGVVIATPAFVAADLVAELDPQLAALCRSIPHTSSAVVVFVFEGDVRNRLPDTHGYVIPRTEGRSVLACSFLSRKLPHRVRSDRAIVRVFIGRHGEPDPLRLDDAALVAIARRELADTLGILDEPLESLVHRWPSGLPQYPVGHLDTVAKIDERLSHHLGLALAGHGYHGIGIPDCIGSGERAVATILTSGRVGTGPGGAAG